jgi:hypothetical protein
MKTCDNRLTSNGRGLLTSLESHQTSCFNQCDQKSVRCHHHCEQDQKEQERKRQQCFQLCQVRTLMRGSIIIVCCHPDICLSVPRRMAGSW